MSNLITTIKDYFVGVFGEVKKITWPTRQQVINQTTVVVVTVIVVAIIFALVDFGFNELVRFIINWRK
jgi:preprotein translocase subunit SecE